MELSELTAYAEEKFHIQEQHKWTAFPGFSVMTDPGTGKWIALLMRQWDSDRGGRNTVLRSEMRPADSFRPSRSVSFPAFSYEGKEMARSYV